MTITRHRLDNVRRRALRRIRGDDYDRNDGRCLAAPEWLVLVVNNFCNLHCKMCDVGLGESSSAFYAHLIGTDRRNMSRDLLETVLGQASRFSPRPRVGLAFTEPLIHRDISALCRTIVERGFFCSITTNGYLLPRLAEDLVEIGVHEIVVSADGPEAVHDRIRGRAGSFRNLFDGVTELNRARSRARRRHPIVRFSYTLTDENYAHMLDFVKEVETLRPASFNFSHLNFISSEMAEVHNARWGDVLPMTRSNLGSIDPGALPLEPMWDALQELEAYSRSHRSLPPVTIVPDLLSPQALETYYRRPLEFVGGRHCTDPWRMLMIRTDGTVIPSHGRCYDVPVGQVLADPLTSIWNSEAFRGFRRLLQENGGTLPACARCCGVIGKPHGGAAAPS
jgi:MoaA/NifB/PqqE/SkfB family radical SAM enzyme